MYARHFEPKTGFPRALRRSDPGENVRSANGLREPGNSFPHFLFTADMHCVSAGAARKLNESPALGVLL